MELGKGCHLRAICPLMLPMTLQFIIAMIATAINDRLQRKLDYVEEESQSGLPILTIFRIRGEI